MCFKTIKNWLYRIYSGKNSMEYILSKYCDDVKLLDSKYNLGPIDDLIQFLKTDDTDLKSYINTYLDCDDFAIMLFGLWKDAMCPDNTGLGLVFVRHPDYLHALNFYVDDEEQVWLVEPQNDSYWLIENEDILKPYFMMI